jgi:hypothetical protein
MPIMAGGEATPNLVSAPDVKVVLTIEPAKTGAGIWMAQ